MNEITTVRVLEVLARHIGRDAGVPMRRLAQEVVDGPASAAEERRVRRCIEALRLDGAHICAHPSDGYYMAENEQELRDCTAFLRERGIHHLRLVAAMEKIALPDLIGQLHLPT